MRQLMRLAHTSAHNFVLPRRSTLRLEALELYRRALARGYIGHGVPLERPCRTRSLPCFRREW